MATTEIANTSKAEQLFQKLKEDSKREGTPLSREESFFPTHERLSPEEIESELAKWDAIECSSEFMQEWVELRKEGIRAGERPWTQEEVSDFIRKVRS